MAEADHAGLLPAEDGIDSDPSSSTISVNEVKDSMTYWLLVLLGCGCLFPWMTLVSAVDYFNLRYSAFNFTVLVSSVYTIPLLVFVILMIPYGPRFSLSLRVQLSFLFFLVLFLAIPALDFIQPAPAVAAVLILVLVGVMGIADAVVQGSLYGVAATLSPIYVQALQAGTGISGLGISSLRVVTKAFFPDNTAGIMTSAYLFFFLAAVLTICCMAGWLMLSRRREIFMHEKHQLQPNTSSEENSTVEGGSSFQMSMLVGGSSQAQLSSILSNIYPLIICIAWNFMVTMLVYPGIVAGIPSSRMGDSSWFPVLLMTLWNWADCAGKSAGHIESLTRIISERGVHVLAILRVLGVVLLIACASRTIHEDFTACCLTSAFAMTNGYVGARLMMLAPTKVATSEREATGIIMLFSLVGGLSLGSLVAIPFAIFLQWAGIIAE